MAEGEKKVSESGLRYDDWYLESYARTRIHQTMIRDKVRTEAYRKAIEMSKHLIKDKVVMDVGCGTGILSLFAAKAGARRVIAVESSDMADSAKQVMIDNKMDHIITVIKNRLEDITELPDGIQKVDVIVSEFMGDTLFFECMLETVVFARDKWLVPDGPILPDICELYIFGVHDAKYKISKVDFWEKVKVTDHTFDFSIMRDAALRRVWKRRLTPDKNVITNAQRLCVIDMSKITIEGLRLKHCEFTLKSRHRKSVICHGVGTYFTATFSRCHVPITISTAPWDPVTHWHQMVFYFRQDVDMEWGTEIEGYWAYRKHPRFHRDLQFVVKVGYTGWNEEFNEKNHYLTC